MEIPEFMVRVKLPDSSSFHSSPSGDSAYEDAYNKALADAVPAGYEVQQPRRNEKWPRDSEGFTWVRLRCIEPYTAIAHWMRRTEQAEKHLERIRTAIGKIESRQ